MSRISSLSGDDGHRSDTDPDVVPQLPVRVKSDKLRRAHSIEMSEDRVRRLSGQIDPDHIRELLDEYDGDQTDGLVCPSDDDAPSSTMDAIEKREIEDFKLKLDDGNDSENEGLDDEDLKERRGSKHNLIRPQQGDEWDADTVENAVEDMKKQLLHLAMNTSGNGLQ